MKLNCGTGTLRSIVIFSVVGAIIFAPATLASVYASAKAKTDSSALSVSSGTAFVIVGSNSASSGNSAHAINSTISSCSFSTTLSSKAKAGDTILNVSSAANLLVGMSAVNPGIPTGAFITNIAVLEVTISQPLTAVIEKTGPTVAFLGCHQQYFSANNIGSITVTNFSIQQTVSGSVPGGFQIQKCSGSWTESTGVCSGTITNILSTISGSSSIIDTGVGLIYQNAGSTDTVRLRAVTTKAGQSTSITSIVKNSSHLRSGITSNS